MRAKRFAAIADAAIEMFDLSLVDAGVKNAINGGVVRQVVTEPRREAEV